MLTHWNTLLGNMLRPLKMLWTKNKTNLKEFKTCYIWKSFMKWLKFLDNTHYTKPYLMFEYTGSSISDIIPNSSCSLPMENLDVGLLSSPDWRSQSEVCLGENSTSGWCFGITEKNYLPAKWKYSLLDHNHYHSISLLITALYKIYVYLLAFCHATKP